MRTRLVGVALGVILVAGCSSSAATPVASGPGAASPSPTTTAPTTPEPASAAPSNGGGNPFDCTGLAGSLAAGGGLGSGPGAGGSSDLDAVADSLRQYAQNGPSEIRDDLLTLADAWAGYVKALSDAGIDLSDPSSFATLDQAQLAKFAEAAEAIDTTEVQQASDNIDAFVTSNCGGY